MCADRPEASQSGLGTRILLKGMYFYQKYISGLTPPSCRFEPTCSNYAIGALREWGAIRGTILTVVRLSKCGPWHPGGIDHVPPRIPV